MKKRNISRIPLTALLLVLTVAIAVLPVFAVSVPRHENYIADDAKLLSEGTVRNITKNNETLWEENGTAIGVCTVKTIGDEAIGDYAARVYQEWGMVEGVLIVVVAENNSEPDRNNYYLIQSTGVQDTITNADLEMLRSDYMETDFAAGNIDRAVFSTATKLTAMLFEVRDPDASAVTEDERSEEKTENKTENNEEDKESEGTTAGGIIVGFFKFLLIAALILLALFILFFIAAMFNDDAAELMRKYVFQRGKTNPVSSDFYDERLYGTNHQIQQRGRQNAQRAAQQNRQRPQNRPANPSQQQYRSAQPAIAPARQYGNPGYPQQSAQNPQLRSGYAQQNAGAQQRPVMYNADGTVRRPRPAQQRPAQNPSQNSQNYQQTRQPRQNYQPADNGATQMFSLHDSNNY